MIMFLAGLGVGMGTVAGAWLAWWLRVSAAVTAVRSPGLYRVAGPPDPTTVSDESEHAGIAVAPAESDKVAGSA